MPDNNMSYDDFEAMYKGWSYSDKKKFHNLVGTGKSGTGTSGAATGSVGAWFKDFVGDVAHIPDGVSQALDSINTLYEGLTKMGRAWAEIDEAASKFTKTLGGSAAGYKQYRDALLQDEWNRRLGAKYGISEVELMNIEQSYASAIGRRVGVQSSDRENIAAMSAVIGGDQTAQLAANLENFGVNLGSVADLTGKMFKEASDYGLSFEEYSKNFVDNIAVAQNYTFKNGIKGLESMAKKATAVKFDLGKAAGFAEQLLSMEGGGIEGSVNAAAKLQVLGGQFSALADPLGILNESLNDMEGLQDRMLGMFKSMGTFNRATGQVEVSSFNKQRIRAAAAAMGMDYSEAMKTVMAQAKRGEIETQMAGAFNGNKKLKELILNSASFNENGVAGMTDANGNFRTLDEIQNDKALQEEILAENQSESDNIRDIAQMLRGYITMTEGLDKQITNKEAITESSVMKILKGLGLDEGISTLTAELVGTVNGLKDINDGTFVNAVNGIEEAVRGVGTILAPIGDIAEGGLALGKGLLKTVGNIFGIGGSKAATGGYLTGPSHASGGMKVEGTNLEVEGGEYIINKYATAENKPLLDIINNSHNPAAGISKKTGGKFANGGVLPKMDEIIAIMSAQRGFGYGFSDFQNNGKIQGGDGYKDVPLGAAVARDNNKEDIIPDIKNVAMDTISTTINNTDYSSMLDTSFETTLGQIQEKIEASKKAAEESFKRAAEIKEKYNSLKIEKPEDKEPFYPYIYKQNSSVTGDVYGNVAAMEKERHIVIPGLDDSLKSMLKHMEDMLNEAKKQNDTAREVVFKEEPKIRLEINITGVNSSMEETFKAMLSEKKFAKDISAAVQRALNNDKNIN